LSQAQKGGLGANLVVEHAKNKTALKLQYQTGKIMVAVAFVLIVFLLLVFFSVMITHFMSANPVASGAPGPASFAHTGIVLLIISTSVTLFLILLATFRFFIFALS